MVALIWLRDKRKYLDYGLLFLVALFVFRSSLFNAGLPLGADAITWVAYPGYLAHNGWWLLTWQGIGFPGAVGEIVPLDLVLTFLFRVFGSPIGVKLLLFATYLMAGVGMYWLAHYWFRSRNIALFSGLLYMAGRAVLDQLILGHLSIVLGYALLPLLPLAWGYMIRRRTLKHILLAAMAFSFFLGSAHLSYLYVALLFLAPYLLWDTIAARLQERGVSWWQFLRPLGLFLLFWVALSMVFLLPTLAGRSIAEQVTDRPLALLLSTIYRESVRDLLESLTLSGVEGGIIFPSVASGALLVMLPLLSFLAWLFRREGRVLLLTLLALFLIFMAKGPNPPMGSLYVWMIENLPYFSGLRTPPRNLLLVSFCYAPLAGIAIDRLCSHIQGLAPFSRLRALGQLSVGKAVPFGLAALLLGAALAPQWPALRFGAKSFSMPSDHLDLYRWLAEQPGDFVVANLPFQGGVGWVDPLNPGAKPGWSSTSEFGIWNSLYHGKTVLAYAQWYPYSRFYLEYNRALNGKTIHMAKLLGAFNVKYVAALPWASAEEKARFAALEGLEEVYRNSSGAIYQNRYWTPRLFAAPRYIAAVGGPQAFPSLATMMGPPPARLVPLVPAFRNQANLEKALDLSDTILFADGDFNDLIFASLQARGSLVLDAVNYVDTSTSNLLGWRANDWHAAQGYSIASSSWSVAATSQDGASLDIPLDVTSPGLYEIWLRAYHEQNRGGLTVALDGQELASLNLRADNTYNAFRWVRAGQSTMEAGRHTLHLTKKGGEGIGEYIDQVAVVQPQALEAEAQRLSRLLQGKDVVLLLQQGRMSSQGEVKAAEESGDGYILATGAGQTITLNVDTPISGDYRLALRPRLEEQISRMGVQVNGEQVAEVGPEEPATFVGPLMVADDDQTAFWAPVNPPEQMALADDAQVKQSGENSLRLDIKPGRAYFTLIQENFAIPQDWSNKRYLTFWFKGTGSGVPLSLEVTSTRDASHYINLQFSDASQDWAQVVIPLPTVSGQETKVDWSQVTGLRLSWNTKDVAGSLYLDGLVAADDIVTPSREAGDVFQWTELKEPLSLHARENTIVLKPQGPMELDLAALYRSPEDASLEQILTYDPEAEPVSLTYERVDPTRYEVKVKADKPFLLHFSETYHPGWRAYVDGKEIAPMVANFHFNGFAIEKTGEYNVTIVYTAQKYASLGTKVSGIAWLVALVYLTILGIREWRRRRQHLEQR